MRSLPTTVDLLERAGELAKVGGWELDVRTMKLFWSLETCRIHEVDPPVAPSLDQAINFYAPEARPVIQAALQAGIDRGTAWDLELPLTTARGKSIWVRAQGSAVMQDGKVSKLIGAFHDITERKRSQEAQQEALNRLHKIASQVPGVIYQFRLRPDGSSCFPFASEAIREIYRVTPEQVRTDASKVFSSLHPDDYDGIVASIQNSARGLTPWIHEYRVKFDDGTVRWLFGNSIPQREADGSTLWHGFITDITKRKEADDRLRESEERFQYALDATHDGLWDWNIKTGQVYFSPQWARLLGYAPDEVPQRVDFFFTILHPEDMDRIRGVLEEHLAGRTPLKQDEVRLRMKSGEYRWFFDRGKVVTRDAAGNPLRMVGTISDITERRRAEEDKARLRAQLQQAQKMESVGRLAGGVAHDFNNMLGVILGNAEIAMAQVAPSQPLHAELAEIQQAAQRSAALTRQLLAFARKQNVAPQVLDLNETVSKSIKMLQRLIGENIRVTWHPMANLWPIKMDPSQVDQILTNLCVNARDAIADIGGIVIETANSVIDDEYCAQRPDIAPGEYVRLTFSDNGCGMDNETIAHIFEPFFTTKAVGVGTGLGLATVYGAVRQNHGLITVSSERGAGTTFTIHLPRYAGKSDMARTNNQAEPSQRGGETILLVEDEPGILKVTARVLESQGYKVLGASTPGEAIRLAREQADEIHLLLTDVVMPDMNGQDLATVMLSLNPLLRRLFMSGYTADVIAQHGVLDEAVFFIQKPFSNQDLITKVRQALDSGGA